MKCLMCDNEVEVNPIYKYLMSARQYGKTMTLIYSYFRERCCSEECFEKWISEVKEYVTKKQGDKHDN